MAKPPSRPHNRLHGDVEAPVSTDMNGPWPDAVLLLVGHGSSRNPASARPTLLHCETLRRRALFADVHGGFLKQAPYADEILHSLDAPDVFIVPNMLCKGYVTTDIIPEKLGLSGPLSMRPGPDGPRRLHLCPPVGTDSQLIAPIAESIRAIIHENRLETKTTCVIIVGHGSDKSRQSRHQTQGAAALLSRQIGTVGVRTAFLEEPPYINDWRTIAQEENLIVVPFLMAGGQHGALDIPDSLDIPRSAEGLSDLEDGSRALIGPYVNTGRRIWYLRPVGLDPVIADLVIRRVGEAVALASAVGDKG